MSEQTNTPRRSLYPWFRYPWFRYSDAPAAIDWLVKVLGFSVHARFDGPGGTVAHELEHSGGRARAARRCRSRVAAVPWSS